MMGILSVIAAAIASYAFGAIWYMSMAKPWMAAAGVTEEQANDKNPKPFIISFIAVIIVAGMMRHVFAQAAITGLMPSLVAGFGLGAFIVTPWIVTNYAFARRPDKLSVIDGVYTIGGCTVMGAVLGLF